jgi:hypothetical protein
MNSLIKIMELTGIEMSDLATNKAGISQLRTIAWCCAIEGEAMEGKEFELSEIEFGRLLDMQSFVQFSKILVEQSTNTGEKQTPEKSSLAGKIFGKGKNKE